MNRLEELNQLIEQKEKELEPLEEERREIWRKQQKESESKLEGALRKKDKFNVDELVFASDAKCRCGAGFAYPENIGPWGSWHCSAILLGEAKEGSTHSPEMPFSMWSVKSEKQPSAEGRTTRPKK